MLLVYTTASFRKLYVANDTGIVKARSVYLGVGLFNLSLVIDIVYLEIFISVAMNQSKFLTIFSEK